MMVQLICALFDDATNRSNYRTSNDSMNGDESERMFKDVVLVSFKALFWYWLGDTRKTRERRYETGDPRTESKCY